MSNLPNVSIDKDAIRFSFDDGSRVNLFWENLFCPMWGQSFHDELLRNIHKAYNECVLTGKVNTVLVPLSDSKITAIAENMPGGLEGFCKGWGWQQFAREIEKAHGIENDMD